MHHVANYSLYKFYYTSVICKAHRFISKCIIILIKHQSHIRYATEIIYVGGLSNMVSVSYYNKFT